jgi:hypothetical protein
MADLTFEDHGTIWLLTPVSDEGHQWVADNIPEDAQTWGKCSIVVEHRYVGAIIDGAMGDGLSVNIHQPNQRRA